MLEGVNGVRLRARRGRRWCAFEGALRPLRVRERGGGTTTLAEPMQDRNRLQTRSRATVTSTDTALTRTDAY